MRGLLLLLLAVLAVTAPASAQEKMPRRDFVAELAKAAGYDALPEGSDSYLRWWEGGFANTAGGLAVIKLPDGKVFASFTEAREPPVQLEPGDLAAFEANLDAAAFPDFSKEGHCGCVDDCFDEYLWANRGGRAAYAHVCTNELNQAIWELSQIVNARRRKTLGVPVPWWSDKTARPVPALNPAACPTRDTACRTAAWQAHLDASKLKPLEPPEWGRAYRLTVLRPGRHPEVTTLILDWVNPGGPCFFTCGEDTPNRARASASDWLLPRTIDFAAVDRWEDGLAAAGFSTLAADADGVACPAGVRWILEARVGDRYRYAAGDSCDRRGLGPTMDQFLKLAGRRPLT
jgi:hypothetical protein